MSPCPETPAPVLRIRSGRPRRRSGDPVLPVPSCPPGATPVLPGQDRVPTARETDMDSAALHPAGRSPGRFVPAFPVRKTGPAVRSGLRFHAGMVRREASGARCEPAVGDVRSARAQLTADQGRLPPWQYPFPARRPQAGSTRETGVRQEIAGLHPATETARHPGNFFPVFCPEFPEKSGRDRLAAYCPHSQPYCLFSPLQIWSGFMPCYQRGKNHHIGQRRFTRAEIPPDTREVSAGVFHHPFRVFRPE